MNTRLIAVTQSMILDEENRPLTPEQLLVFIARVSNPENQMNHATADKLIAYLISHKHWSPFDMVNLVMEVKTSRVIAQQILRHWSIKPQEFSQRYSAVVDVEPIQLRKTAQKNRQSSEEEWNPYIVVNTSFRDLKGNEIFTKGPAKEVVDNFVKYSQDLYNELLEKGVAKECARFVLPLATSTTMYLNGSVRSWIHYLEQRTSQHAQKEHRDVAFQIEDTFEKIFPNVVKAVKVLNG